MRDDEGAHGHQPFRPTGPDAYFDLSRHSRRAGARLVRRGAGGLEDRGPAGDLGLDQRLQRGAAAAGLSRG